MKKLELYSGNILNFTEGKDLIVNSANKYMIFGSGVCGAIYRAAGVDLLEQYCKSHFEERKMIPATIIIALIGCTAVLSSRRRKSN